MHAKCTIPRQKNPKIFWRGGAASSPDPSPLGRGTPPHQTPPPHAFCAQPQTKILDPPVCVWSPKNSLYYTMPPPPLGMGPGGAVPPPQKFIFHFGPQNGHFRCIVGAGGDASHISPWILHLRQQSRTQQRRKKVLARSLFCCSNSQVCYPVETAPWPCSMRANLHQYSFTPVQTDQTAFGRKIPVARLRPRPHFIP